MILVVANCLECMHPIAANHKKQWNSSSLLSCSAMECLGLWAWTTGRAPATNGSSLRLSPLVDARNESIASVNKPTLPFLYLSLYLYL